MTITHLDLFSGFGGFAIAAKLMGFKTVQFVEIEPYCKLVLNKNFPEIPIHDDIKTFHPKQDYTLVTAGSPCQGFSADGKGQGIEDPRSGLAKEMLRVLDECQPDYFIWENVRGSHARGGLQIICECLYRGGYKFDAQLISAEEVGLSHHQRERVFVCAYSLRIQQAIGGKVCGSWADQARSSIERVRSFGLSEEPQPPIRRVVDGVSDRLVRGRGLGNAVTPQQAIVAMMRVEYLQSLVQ